MRLWHWQNDTKKGRGVGVQVSLLTLITHEATYLLLCQMTLANVCPFSVAIWPPTEKSVSCDRYNWIISHGHISSASMILSTYEYFTGNSVLLQG